MSAEIEYKGEEILYREDSDEWTWYAGSFSHAQLQRVKYEIDKSLKVEFDGAEAWVDGAPEWFKVSVTSRAEGLDYDKRASYWTTGEKGRSKRSAKSLFAVTSENDAVIQRIQELRRQIKALRSQEELAAQDLIPFEQFLKSNNAR